MASLHKRQNSPYWVASYQDSQGRWLKKSTKAKDRATAWKIAIEWEELESAGKAGRLIESQCRKVVSEIHEKVMGAPVVFYTCRAWLEEWLAGKAGAAEHRTMQKYKHVIESFIEHLGARAEQPLNAISGKDIRSFRDALKKTGIAPSTVNTNVRKILSVPFLAAFRAGFVPVNPVAGVEALLDDSEGEKDVFSTEQLNALLEAAEGDWVGMIYVGYYTGLRLNDAANLTWDKVDLETGFLRGVKPSKTKRSGKVLHLPIEPELLEWLASQPRGVGKAPVFPSIFGKGGGGKSGLSKQFIRIMHKAGIKGRIVRIARGEKGRQFSSLSFHSLRHTCNSVMHANGVSQEDRMRITGHSSTRVNDGYTHAEERTIRETTSKIPRIRAKA
ncbi:MAG: site-specific integrase [Verrucomicrobiota bacterium]